MTYTACEDVPEVFEVSWSNCKPHEVCGWTGGGTLSGLLWGGTSQFNKTAAIAAYLKPKTKKEIRQWGWWDIIECLWLIIETSPVH